MIYFENKVGKTCVLFWDCISLNHQLIINNQKYNDMTIEQMTTRIIERAKELLKMPEVQAIYQSKENETDAKEWIMNQALITLMYSHEERMEMMNKKLAIN